MTDLATDKHAAADSSTRPGADSPGTRIRSASAGFWLAFMFWWTEHVPRVVLLTRPFFLWGTWRFATGLREGTLANARRLLQDDAPGSPRAKALAKSIIRSFYTSVYELGCCVRLTRQQMLARIDKVEGLEHYVEARKKAKGAIIVSAHLGSFELGAAALTEHEKRIHLVFQHDAHPRFDRLRSRLRERLGVIEVPVDDGWSMWVRLRDALLADDVVIILGDRVMPGQRGQRVPFLGGHILVPTGPLKLAMATGAPIIPIFSIRTRVGHVRVVIEEPIEVSRETVGAAASDGGQPPIVKLAAAIEKHVGANPEQWLMVEPVWCEDLDQRETGE